MPHVLQQFYPDLHPEKSYHPTQGIIDIMYDELGISPDVTIYHNNVTDDIGGAECDPRDPEHGKVLYPGPCQKCIYRPGCPPLLDHQFEIMDEIPLQSGDSLSDLTE